MKKINILMVGLLLMVGFNACQKDEIVTINPAAETGDMTFVLNQTQYQNFTYELLEENNALDMDALYCSQPDYGFTAAVTYYIQASFSQDMKDLVELASSVQGEKVAINTKDMNKAMLALYNGTMPNPSVAKDVFVRLKAVVSDATKKPVPLETVKTVKPIFSNVVKLNILPYFMEDLVPYDKAKKLLPYYIVGYNGWNNDVSGLGSDLVPLSVVPGNKYNSDGQGTYTYTGYFDSAKEFKLIRDIGSWVEQWGNKGSAGIDQPMNKAISGQEPSNFKVPESGYYTITLNSILNEISITKASITAPTVYTSMGLIGQFNGWGGDEVMTAYQTDGDNHVWYKEMTFTIDDNFLFRAEGNWDLKFGAPSGTKGDPAFQFVGLGVLGGGSDIRETAGTYVMIINDIDGCYYAIKK